MRASYSLPLQKTETTRRWTTPLSFLSAPPTKSSKVRFQSLHQPHPAGIFTSLSFPQLRLAPGGRCRAFFRWSDSRMLSASLTMRSISASDKPPLERMVMACFLPRKTSDAACSLYQYPKQHVPWRLGTLLRNSVPLLQPSVPV